MLFAEREDYILTSEIGKGKPPPLEDSVLEAIQDITMKHLRIALYKIYPEVIWNKFCYEEISLELCKYFKKIPTSNIQKTLDKIKELSETSRKKSVEKKKAQMLRTEQNAALSNRLQMYYNEKVTWSDLKAVFSQAFPDHDWTRVKPKKMLENLNPCYDQVIIKFAKIVREKRKLKNIQINETVDKILG